jgi:hypothetical protein
MVSILSNNELKCNVSFVLTFLPSPLFLFLSNIKSEKTHVIHLLVVDNVAHILYFTNIFIYQINILTIVTILRISFSSVVPALEHPPIVPTARCKSKSFSIYYYFSNRVLFKTLKLTSFLRKKRDSF